MGDTATLIEEVVKEIKKVVPDVNEDRAMRTAQYLVSEEMGVRTINRLIDVELDALNEHLPRCDAKAVYNSWQVKFKPQNVARRMAASTNAPYNIPWNKVAGSTLDLLKAGKAIPKVPRCAMLRIIVEDVRDSMPGVQRAFFDTVAQLMVKAYPQSLQDKGRGTTPGQWSFIARKLKCTFDEFMRPTREKQLNEAPSIPQAYGCVRWRVAEVPPNETTQSLKNKQDSMKQYYMDQRPQEWNWKEIDGFMKATYKLQRDDINSQVPPKKRRATGAAQQQPAPPQKTTQEIVSDWPFLFLPRGTNIHFTILTGVNFIEKMQAFDEAYDTTQFVEFLRTKNDKNQRLYRKFIRATERGTCEDPHVIAICLMLIETFNEEKNLFLIEAEETTRVDEVQRDCRPPPTPCLVSLGPVFKAKKFVLCVDSEPVSTTPNFWAGLSAVFEIYFVLNIKYPKDLGRTMEFYQREIAGINPSRGTKMTKKNYRSKVAEQLQTLMEEFQVWLEKEENMDIDVDEPQAVM